MKKLIRAAVLFCAALALLCSFALTCAAAEPRCSLAVNLADSEKQPIDDLAVFAVKVADVDGENYVLSEEFAASQISLAAVVNDPSALNAKALADYADKRSLPALSAVSASGKAEFPALDEGIWVVYSDKNGQYKFNPYIVFLPCSVGGKLSYELDSAPKTEPNIPDSKSIYVVKKWEDRNNVASTRPDSITVELRRDGSSVATAVLNESNGWAHTFVGLSDEGKYSVTEKAVADYTAKYNGDSENGFVITNVYSGDKLPDTGENNALLLWVAALFVSGMTLFGAVRRIKKKKSE